MKPKKPPKLWAIYGPDGERLTKPYEIKWYAWSDIPGHTMTLGARIKKLKKLGYTCCEVEIVRVQK